MKHYLLILICYMLSSACNSRMSNDKPGINRKQDSAKHEKTIDSLQLSDLVKESKWFLYNIHVDDTCAWKQEYAKLPKTYLSSLPLEIDNIFIYGDTTEVIINFYYADTLRCDYYSIGNAEEITDGVGFNHKSKEFLYFISGTARFTETGERSRYAHPLQPDVREFLQKNKDKLHPWLRNEAIKRNVIH